MKITCPHCKITVEIESLKELQERLKHFEETLYVVDLSDIDKNKEKQKHLKNLAITIRDTLTKIRLYDK